MSERKVNKETEEILAARDCENCGARQINMYCKCSVFSFGWCKDKSAWVPKFDTMGRLVK